MSDIDDRLSKILDFWEETEKFKLVERIPVLSDKKRRENDAEHSWHLCLMLMTMEKELGIKFDLGHALKLATVHDLAELDTGDDWVTTVEAKKKKHEAEAEAAARIFGLLPQETSEEFYDLWLEYEEGKTPEAKVVKAIDKICYVLQYGISGEIVWHGPECKNNDRKDYAMPHINFDDKLVKVLIHYSDKIEELNKDGQK